LAKKLSYQRSGGSQRYENHGKTQNKHRGIKKDNFSLRSSCTLMEKFIERNTGDKRKIGRQNGKNAGRKKGNDSCSQSTK